MTISAVPGVIIGEPLGSELERELRVFRQETRDQQAIIDGKLYFVFLSMTYKCLFICRPKIALIRPT